MEALAQEREEIKKSEAKENTDMEIAINGMKAVGYFKDVTKHRIVLNTKARVSHVSELSVIDEILKAVKQPTTYVKKAGNRD